LRTFDLDPRLCAYLAPRRGNRHTNIEINLLGDYKRSANTLQYALSGLTIKWQRRNRCKSKSLKSFVYEPIEGFGAGFSGIHGIMGIISASHLRPGTVLG
jgi:hypothetical protein